MANNEAHICACGAVYLHGAPERYEQEIDEITLYCPTCGGRDLFNAAECAECGRHVPSYQIDNDLCNVCQMDARRAYERFVEPMSEAQRDYIRSLALRSIA